MPITLTRIYNPDQATGFRILIDRLWPRGVSKDSAAMDAWFKDLAPSNELRKAYHAGEVTFAAFGKAYTAELKNIESEQLDEVLQRLRGGEEVTLLYAAKDEEQNHAMVLRAFLEQQL